jgi:threonine synthase
VGCEPASAVTLAGLKKLRAKGFVKPGETVILILTGHLLKDPDFTIKFHRGDLFAGTPEERHATQLKSLQRAPIVLDADIGAVIGALDAAERNS